ncbi:MAG: cyclic nucleotide-binding domain-containing protein [Polyangiales bacterium]
MPTVGQLYHNATDALLRGDYEAALRGYTCIVALQPHHLDARIRLADTLLAMGEVQSAAAVYSGAARQGTWAGHPLRAMICIKLLTSLAPELAELQSQLAALYAAGSSRLGPSLRLPCGDNTLEATPEALQAIHVRSVRTLVPQAAALGADLRALDGTWPERLPPVPLLSTLPQEGFVALLKSATLRRARPGQDVIRQGEAGQSFFMLARGQLGVHQRQSPGRAAAEAECKLAELHPGAVVGELALLSSAARTASVRAMNDSDLLEFDAAALNALGQSRQKVAAALERFSRERLLQSLMQHSPLFQALQPKQRLDLIRRFRGLNVPAGTRLVQEGAQGEGLFAILHGGVAVYKQHAGGRTHVATLGPTAIFGEISLLDARPITADVETTQDSTLLFLEAHYFQKLMAALPALRGAMEGLSESRLLDTQMQLAAHVDTTDPGLDLQLIDAG